MTRGKHWLGISGTAVPLFLLYLATMPRDLSWVNWGGDAGELISAVVTRGIPHPPGYPLYLYLGWFWQWLPWGSMAFRFHVFSAATVAVAAGLLAATVRHQGETSLPAMLGVGWIFGLAYIPWSQATIAEVYGLNLLLVALLLYGWVRQWPPLGIGLLFGGAICTHLSALLLAPLLIIPAENSYSHLIKRFFYISFGTLCGLIPFAFLPVWLHPASPIQWGDLSNGAGWRWLISGELYWGNAFALSANAYAFRLSRWAGQLLAALTPLMWPLAGVVWWWQYRSDNRERHRRGILLGGTAVFFLLFAFFYLPDDALVLTGPAWLLLALHLAPAFHRWPRLAIVLPLFAVLMNYGALNNREGPTVVPVAREALLQLPEHALLTSDDGPTTFTLWYMQHVTGIRSDVLVVDYHLFAFDWYRQALQERTPSVMVPVQDDWTLFINNSLMVRPYCQIVINTDNRGAYQSQLDCERNPDS